MKKRIEVTIDILDKADQRASVLSSFTVAQLIAETVTTFGLPFKAYYLALKTDQIALEEASTLEALAIPDKSVLILREY